MLAASPNPRASATSLHRVEARLPWTISMRRGHLLFKTVLFLVFFAGVVWRATVRDHVVPTPILILMCLMSAVLLALSRSVVLRKDGIRITRLCGVSRTVPYGDIRDVERKLGTIRVTRHDGSQESFPVTLPDVDRERVTDWLRGQSRAATFD